MRILILGAGAIGGYYGARLIEAGVDVTFLVRPARAALLVDRGLHVHSEHGDFARSVNVVTAVAANTHYDLVIVSCKAYDLDAAIIAITPAVGLDTRVLPLLNGLRQLDALEIAFGVQRVLGGVCHISVTLDGEVGIRQFGALQRLTFGSRDPVQPVPASISAALRGLGEHVVASDDVLAAMWEKFALIAALAGITCLVRGSVGALAATAEGAQLARRLHAECAQVALRSGHPLAALAVADAEGILTTPRSPLKASMLRDLERGSRTECEHVLGDMRDRAVAHALDTPLLAIALTHLRVYEAARAIGEP